MRYLNQDDARQAGEGKTLSGGTVMGVSSAQKRFKSSWSL
jgi:hypothetical protein